MENCPVEILLNIFIPLCNDGGFMARSLSLVSKYIHHASRDLIFQSVMCTHTNQLLKFADALDRASQNHRNVRHLYISSSLRDKISWSELADPPARPPSWCSGCLNEQLKSTTDPDDNCNCSFVYNAIRRILAHAAPSLQTLVLALHWSRWGTLPLPTKFPLLAELSISHEFVNDQLPSNGFGLLESVPCLRRFIPAGFKRVWNDDHLLLTISDFAPSITHFGTMMTNGDYMKTLLERIAIRMGKAVVSQDISAADFDYLNAQVFPGTVQHLLIDDSSRWIEYRQTKGSFAFVKCSRAIAYAQRSESFRLDTALALRRHWLERLEGGEGLWTLDDMQITTDCGGHNASNLMRAYEYELTSGSHSDSQL